jgi:hypothetical protein
MAWPITQYTSCDSIRALLGVSNEEMEDAELETEEYEGSLDIDLANIEAGLPALFQDTLDVAPSERTPLQQRFLYLTRNLAALHIARRAGSWLAMSAKTIGDGQATMSRFADSPYQTTLARIDQEYQSMRFSLASALAALDPEASAPLSTLLTLLAGARASVDRVTGE